MNSREKQSLLDDVFLQAGGAPFRPEYRLSTQRVDWIRAKAGFDPVILV
jgi:hypothetical protein